MVARGKGKRKGISSVDQSRKNSQEPQLRLKVATVLSVGVFPFLPLFPHRGIDCTCKNAFSLFFFFLPFARKEAEGVGEKREE